ncbi:MAG: CBS domain-containing protein [Rubrivivax sp.]|nr:CBS domain-containing protein [Rubrivivax sp.]MDP3084770.1 CBS domain-containing protein [Rubrivivax sp.]
MLVRNILEAKGAVLYTVHPDALLSECVITMADEDVGSLVVMDGAKLVGIVTFREVIRVLARRQKELRQGPTPAVAELKVRDVMATDPICATLDTELHDLRALMIKHHQRYLPVMDNDVLAGVVSFHDVAKSVYEQQLFENKMLKAYIRDWPEESATP